IPLITSSKLLLPPRVNLAISLAFLVPSMLTETVSYTHLDVYKRQLLPPRVNLAISLAFLVPSMLTEMLTHTHLDVYKRQEDI
ncbi:hypothetical protein AZ021_000852, partial [Enterobacter ludwigii]